MADNEGVSVELFPDRFTLLYDNGRIADLPIISTAPVLGERIRVMNEEEGRYASLSTPSLSKTEIAEKLYRYDRMADNRADVVEELTEEHFRQFRELGYLVVNRLLDEEEVEAALVDLQHIIHGDIEGPRVEVTDKTLILDTAEKKELAVRKISGFVDYAPALMHVKNHPAIESVLERFFGEKARFLTDQAILKPPSESAGMEKPWHQDMAYGMLSQTKLICGVWVSLDRAGLDNGCMHIVPGSHKDGPMPHYAVRDWQLCDSRVAIDQDHAVVLEPGGALFFCGLLHHGTPPNLSGKRRRALQFHYCPDSSQRMTPREFKLTFTTDMTKAEC